MHFAALYSAFLAAVVTVFPAPAARAQSSPGLVFGEVGLGADSGDQETAASGYATGVFQITGWHGLQLGLGLADRPGGMIGQIDGHVYLMPGPATKYGIVLSLADVDNREVTIGSAGIEGMWQLGPNTFVSGQAVLGYARPGNIDFIGVSLGLSQAVWDRASVFATLDVAEFDEAILRTTAYTGRAGINWQPAGTSLDLVAALAADGLTGDLSGSGDLRLELGLTWRFGTSGGARRPVAERAFRAWQPFDPLLRRGLF